MPFPKLTPLQSRLAASVTASVLLLLLYLALFSPHFAYAADVDSMRPEDHNHERLLETYMLDDALEETDDLELRQVAYESEFLGADRGIIGRAPDDVTALANNVPSLINVPQGTTKHFVFENSSLSLPLSNTTTGLPSPVRLRRTNDEDTRERGIEDEAEPLRLQSRQTAGTTVYITLTTCMQPYNPGDQTGGGGPPPQLELYYSTSQRNTMPGPGNVAEQTKVTVTGGYANVTLQASDSVWIGVFAPNSTSNGFVDPYSVEIAASIDAQYHQYNSSEPNLYLIDSDTSSALLVTNNLTTTTNGTLFDKWMGLSPPPFVIFASNTNYSAIEGVRNSYCGLEKYAIIAGTKGGVRTNTVQTSMTNETLGPYAKQQFYFKGLNGSSTYYGILGITGNSTTTGAGVVGGGGRIYRGMTFSTQSDGNCAVVFNMSFCKSAAYAVPGNPATFPAVTDLAAFYDNYAQSQYRFFQNALAQIPCDIESSGKYSLVRTCDDCAAAYKDWLCSVLIPRCKDYSSTKSWLHERNIVQAYPNGTMLPDSVVQAAQNVMYLNSSRNPNIDVVVKPGPYKEVLPCDYLCYNLVQSCPASLGFACPLPGMAGFNHSYGVKPNSSADQFGQITCNYPGAVYALGTGSRIGTSVTWSVIITCLFGVFLM